MILSAGAHLPLRNLHGARIERIGPARPVDARFLARWNFARGRQPRASPDPFVTLITWTVGRAVQPHRPRPSATSKVFFLKPSTALSTEATLGSERKSKTWEGTDADHAFRLAAGIAGRDTSSLWPQRSRCTGQRRCPPSLHARCDAALLGIHSGRGKGHIVHVGETGAAQPRMPPRHARRIQGRQACGVPP